MRKQFIARAIPEWEGYYAICENGMVLRKEREITDPENPLKTRKLRKRVMTERVDSKGYNYVTLIAEGEERPSRRLAVHRAVAIAFVDNPNEYFHVRHKDGDRTNNHKDNLEWVKNTEACKSSI